MTVLAMLVAALRHWWLVALGAIATVGVCALIVSAPALYWAQADVVFTGAVSQDRPNPLGYTSARLVDMASVVQRSVTGASSQPKVVSSGVSIVDAGITEGWWIRLPNSGGQWTINFERPVLDVQVVGHDPAEVGQRMQDLLGRIQDSLAQRQRDAGVTGESLVHATVTPPSAGEVRQVAGPTKRALAMTLLVGGGLTLVAADAWDRRRHRLRGRTRGSRRSARRARAAREQGVATVSSTSATSLPAG